MSIKKKDDSKISFFKIDREGDLEPMFPDEPARMEPVFEPSEELAPAVDEPVMTRDPSEAFLEEQLHLLKPQVEDIAKAGDELSADQAEVLKKYISLKEAEVRDLRDQQRQYQGVLKKVSSQLEAQSRKTRDALSELENVKRREEAVRADLSDLQSKMREDMAHLKSDFEDRLRKSGNYDQQVDDLMKQREEWREKVREDLKRIKLKERELENKYELLKRDTQALLDSKDKHVLELKKKNDALELELESLEDRLRRGNAVMGQIDSKKRRLVETMKLAISLLEEIDRAEVGAKDDERKAG